MQVLPFLFSRMCYYFGVRMHTHKENVIVIKKKNSYTAEQKTEILGYVNTHGFDLACAQYPGITKLQVANWKRFGNNPKPSATHKSVFVAKDENVVASGELIIENRRLRSVIVTLLGMDG